MNIDNLRLGQVVRSIAGRDKGNFMVVIEKADKQFVKICDGKIRKVDKAKRKKIKHLAETNHIILQIENKLMNKQKITNAEIRKHLEPYTKIPNEGDGRFE